MLLLLANSLDISAWDVCELREFLLAFFLCNSGCLEQSVCLFIEREGFVLGISLWFSLSQWTLLKKTSAELLLPQRSPEDLNMLPGQLKL